jgi:two-component system chemotaxis response regulator CheY
MKMKKSVLLIDDDADEHEWFKAALQSYNPDICFISARGSADSIDLLKGFSPDVILLDFNMPGFNGLECLQMIKQRPFIRDIPVYIYSISNITEKQKLQAITLGAEKWITKPVKQEDYLNVFLEILG